jgi:hypothetical protein
VDLATLDQFYAYGLRSELLVRSGRAAASIDPASNTIALPLHGAALNDEVSFSLPSSAGALPGGLSLGVTYYAIPVDGGAFKVSATSGGAAIDLTTAGTGPVLVSFSAEPRIRLEVSAASSEAAAALLVASDVVDPVPLEVVKTVCHLAAFEVAGSLGLLNPAQPTHDIELIKARYEAAQKRLDRWRNGQRPARLVDAASTTTEDGAVGWGDADRGWLCGGSL